MNTSTEAPDQAPPGLVVSEVMLAHFWPHEESRPSDFKLRDLCARGLPHYRIGRRYYFRLKDVGAWIERKAVKPPIKRKER